jgi:hypothetical protein
MRTTLAIDDDVLLAAKHVAKLDQRTISAVISSLARQGLAASGQTAPTQRNGIPLLLRNTASQPVTIALVNQLRDAGT